MYYILWCNSDRLYMNFEFGAHVQVFLTTWTTLALSHGVSLRMSTPIACEVTKSIRRFGKSMLKNNSHANVRMATVPISLFR